MAQADILITGATGFVGGKLLETLRDNGRVRVLVRHADKLGRSDDVDVVEGDLGDGGDVRRALEGIDVAFYLVHSMEPGDDDFAAKDRRMAERFLAAAEDAGVSRLIYLGGIEPPGQPSEHLRSRIEVERVLGSGAPDLVALRASMVVGQHSDSFRTLVQIVDHLPVLALPPWRSNRTQPVAIDDIVQAFQAALEVEPGSYNVAGPDELTIEAMCGVIGELLGNERPSIPLPFTAAKLEAAAASTVADSDRAVLKPLLEGMHDDLRVPDNQLEQIFGVTPTPFRDAAAKAIEQIKAEPDGGAQAA